MKRKKILACTIAVALIMSTLCACSSGDKDKSDKDEEIEETTTSIEAVEDDSDEDIDEDIDEADSDEEDVEETTEESIQETLPDDFVFDESTAFSMIVNGHTSVTPTGLSLECNTICSHETAALDGEPVIFEVIDPNGDVVYTSTFEYETWLNHYESLYPSDCGVEEFEIGTYTGRSSFVNYDYSVSITWEVVPAEG